MEGHWRAKEGLVANVTALSEEFKAKHGLTPMRILVQGAPLTGKSRLTAELSSYYGLPIVDLKAAFLEAASLPEEEWGHPDWGTLAPAAPAEEGAEEDAPVRRVAIEIGDVTDTALLGSLIRWKLGSKAYACSGWILDEASLATSAQCEAVFLKPPPELAEGEEPPAEAPEPEVEAAYAPSKVLWLEASDEDLEARRLKICEVGGEYVLDGYTDTEESFAAKLAEYRASLDEGGASSRKLLEARCSQAFAELAPGAWPDTSADARESLGTPKNFIGPGHLLSDDWVPPVEEEVVDKPLAVPAAIAAIRQEKADKIANRDRDAEISENQSLYEDAMPLREHLLQVAMPAVTEALVLACEEQPADAIDFVQRFLFDYEERENRNTVAKAREVQTAAKMAKDVAEAEAARAEREKGADEKVKKKK